MSWRESTSRTVQDDLDRVLDEALGAAEELLPAGDFLPFAIVLQDGEASARGTDDDDAAAALPALVAGLRGEREQLTAVGLTYVAVVAGADAVQVEIEHREAGAPVLALSVPFARRGTSVELGDLRAASASRRIWD